MKAMNASLQRRFQANIGKYSWYKIFTKRVYLPLITIQLVNEGHVTVEQLAIMVVVSSAVQALLQMPAGYVADRWGNRASIIMGAAIAVTSPLFYVFMPNFYGGLIASVLFFGGYAFQSGAIEAFIHDTLVVLGQEKDYAKVMGRAQTYGLVGNIILITLVPATYALNHTLPFILGFISLAVMLWLTISFTYPERDDTHAAPRNPLRAFKAIVTAENVLLFIFAGLMAGVANKGAEYQQLLLQNLGVAVALFGVLLAAGSLVGAVMGWYVHQLDRVKTLAFYLLDVVVMAVCLTMVGTSTNPWLAVIGFTLFAGYTRVRLIIFQAKLLHEIQHAYKATLISALNLFTLFGDILAITVLTKYVSSQGYGAGYVSFGLTVLAAGVALWLLLLIHTRSRRPLSTQVPASLVE
jgi:MFS family permease